MDKNLKGALICLVLLLILVPIWGYLMFGKNQSEEIKIINSSDNPSIRIEKDGKLIDTVYIYKE